MKSRTSIITALAVTNVLTLLLLFAGCSDGSAPQSNQPTPGTNCYHASSNATGFPGLNAMLAKALVANYRNHQLSAINGPANGDVPATSDARSVWFSLDVLKRFIYEIESKTCAACGNDSKTLGVRIYYGAYPDASVWNQAPWADALQGVDPAYAGKHTVMMVPTYRNGTNDIDFDPNQVASGCDFTHIETFYDRMKNNAASIDLTVLSSINGSMQNHGELVPPPFDNEQILDKGAAIMFAADNLQQ